MLFENSSGESNGLESIGRKVAMGFAAVMLVGALIAGGYLIFGAKKKTNDVSLQPAADSNSRQFRVSTVQSGPNVNNASQPESPSKITINPPEQPVSEVNGWGIYKNNYFKVSFRYPVSWAVTEESKLESSGGHLTLSIRPLGKNKIYSLGTAENQLIVDPAVSFTILAIEADLKKMVIDSCADVNSKSCIKLSKKTENLETGAEIKLSVQCEKDSDRRLAGIIKGQYIYAFSFPNICLSNEEINRYPEVLNEYTMFIGRYNDVYRSIENSLVVGN